MPYTLKKNKFKYKNPDTGNYEGVDVVAERSFADYQSALENVGLQQQTVVRSEGTTQKNAVTAAGTAAVANFPATASACDTLAGDFAATYVPDQAYAVGDYCTYQYQLYQCKTAIAVNTDHTFVTSHWNLITVTDTINDQVDDLKTQLNDDELSIVENSATIGTKLFFNNTFSHSTYIAGESTTDITAKTGWKVKVGLTDTENSGFDCYLYVKYVGDATHTNLGNVLTEGSTYTFTATKDVESVDIYKSSGLVSGTATLAVEAYNPNGLIKDVEDIENMLEDETQTITVSPDITPNYWIGSDGTISAQSGYSVTDYIDTASGIEFTVSGMNSSYIYYCFYDANKNPIGVRNQCYDDVAISINNDAKYFAVTTASAGLTAGTIKVKKYTRITSLEKEVESFARINSKTTVNPSAIINDFMIKASDGSVVSTNVFACTDYLELPFEENQSIEVIGSFLGTGGCAIYNSKKQRILGVDGNNVSTYGGTAASSIQRISIPYQTGMKYIRISGIKSLVNNDPSKLGVIGYTFDGVYKHLFALEETAGANIPNKIAKSKVLVVGDSISSDVYGDYPKWVTDLIQDGFLPADTNNSSQHATGFVATASGTYDNFVTRLKAVTTPSSYDMVIVFGGINDYLQNIPMGTESGTDYTVSFKPAVNEFFDYLVENFTQARLCVLLPLRSYHTGKNTENEYQQAYGDYIKQVAKSYCLPVLNLTEDSGFFPFIDTFKNMWTLVPTGQSAHDGVHPNEEFEAKYLAPMIRHFLQGLM